MYSDGEIVDAQRAHPEPTVEDREEVDVKTVVLRVAPVLLNEMSAARMPQYPRRVLVLLFIILLIHEDLIDISIKIFDVFLHKGVLIPHVRQKTFHIGVFSPSNHYSARMPVEFRVAAGGQECPLTRSCAGETEFPGIVSRVEHFCCTAFLGMGKGH